MRQLQHFGIGIDKSKNRRKFMNSKERIDDAIKTKKLQGYAKDQILQSREDRFDQRYAPKKRNK